jgi:hypothetical protein
MSKLTDVGNAALRPLLGSGPRTIVGALHMQVSHCNSVIMSDSELGRGCVLLLKITRMH